jgi:UDP-N-acetyl-D-mannosaminuronic acid dehydrogenase
VVNKHVATEADVAVVGMGYVGLVLATAFAAGGLRVLGVDTDRGVREAIGELRSPFFEPGLEDLLKSLPEGQLTIVDRLPDILPSCVVVCVGTPLYEGGTRPDLRPIEAAAEAIAPRLTPETLTIIRSTVPVGTCRRIVLPILRQGVPRPLLACCPERTIQGAAVREIRTLPQVIGGVDAKSTDAALRLFSAVTQEPVTVSSLEAAEMVKLVCNAHTEVIYGFGNEIALITTALGLDADEVIASANKGYPRPDLSHPGYVGGSCLTKDPYLLTHASAEAGHLPAILTSACAVNQSIPEHVATRVLEALKSTDRDIQSCTILLCGVAYKGQPETDDVRGSAAPEVARHLKGALGTLRAHDFAVSPSRIAALGFEPVDLGVGLIDADALVLLVNHPGYQAIDLAMIREKMRRSPVIFDVWGLLKHSLQDAEDLIYLRLGNG